MREILFRGKRKDIHTWVHGDYTKYAFTEVPCICDEDHWAEVIPETVTQYTGLKDAYGTKIFEGDFLESIFKPLSKKIGTLIYVTDIRDCKYISLYSTQYKVIGNVWDNPELLKGEISDQ